MKQIFFLFSLCFLISCVSASKDAVVNNGYEVQHAQGFTVNKQADYTQVTVRDPWDTTKILQSYILVDKSIKLPINLPKGKIVRTPLSKVAVTSTIHCSTLEELKTLSIVKAVCEPEYIDIAAIQKGVADKSIVDLGQASSIDIEKAILLDPEVIFTSPIQGMSYGGIEKTDITLVETPDYMESSPLGRAEWLRFYSLFIGQEALADSLFEVTKKNYLEIKNLVAQSESKPSVLLDTKYGNVWYIAGGQSYMANMIKDAGASYVWADNISTGSIPMSFEQVLDKGEKAQFWLIKYNAPKTMTYASLKNEYKLYEHFAAFEHKNIFECNTKDYSYYEDLPIHPDWILKDFAAVFHPDLFEGYQEKYYRRMED